MFISRSSSKLSLNKNDWETPKSSRSNSKKIFPVIYEKSKAKRENSEEIKSKALNTSAYYSIFMFLTHSSKYAC